MTAEARVHPYIWFWRQKPGWDRGTPPRLFDCDRKGERLRVICRGTMNSALLRVEDGCWTLGDLRFEVEHAPASNGDDEITQVGPDVELIQAVTDFAKVAVALDHHQAREAAVRMMGLTAAPMSLVEPAPDEEKR